MSNAIRFKADETDFRSDAATARRRFWRSLGVRLAVLAAAAMIAAQPTRARVGAKSSAPEFVDSFAAAQLRRAMRDGARQSAS